MYVALLAFVVVVTFDRVAKSVVSRTNFRKVQGRMADHRGPLIARLAGQRIAVAALLVAAVAVGAAISAGAAFSSPIAQAAVGGALGGAAANALDGLGGRDPVDILRIGRWPRFNFADVAINAGAFVALATLLT